MTERRSPRVAEVQLSPSRPGEQLKQARFGGGRDLTGLGELEACLDKKDFDSCSGLAADVLIGSELKALDKAFDALKLLKRGCKIVSKVPGVAPVSSLSPARSSSDYGCLEGEIDFDVYRARSP
ncbi:hypothetical protein ACIQZB_30630 [Streptomyces sp. NPDC097727]|uniref:hypothetical protein n=1 Tax=Streptomyces sp. NPDC097727 TaxID=3366092 RepID=UPI00381C06B1